MSFITESTNVLIAPFSRDLGGNTYQYETRTIMGGTRKRSYKRMKRNNKSKRSKPRVTRSRKRTIVKR